MRLEFYKYNREGEDDFSARIAVQAFGALTSIAGLTTLLLLSMGWSVLRERLPPREAQFAKAGALLYFVFQFGASVCSDTTSVSTWKMNKPVSPFGMITVPTYTPSSASTSLIQMFVCRAVVIRLCLDVIDWWMRAFVRKRAKRFRWWPL